MFCDGKCIKGSKRCGLYDEYLMKEAMTEKDVIINKCVFKEMVSSLHRLESGSDRLHTAVNSQRNEEVEIGHDIQGVIANLGLVVHKAITGDPSAQINYNNINKILEKCDDGEDQGK